MGKSDRLSAAMMIDLQAVLQVVETLSVDDKQRLLEYLQSQHVHEIVAEGTQRVLDLHRGAITMRDDFDDELPDSFWLGDE